MSDDAPDRIKSIIRLRLDEKSFVRRRPEVEHEREIAVFDLLEDNTFVLVGDGAHPGPYHLQVALKGDRLVLDVFDTSDMAVRQIGLAIKPFHMLVKDYFIVCESYFDAIKSSSPSQIEAIDMGRRALHNEGADGLRERLAADVTMDHATARRFFTLLCVLKMRG